MPPLATPLAKTVGEGLSSTVLGSELFGGKLGAVGKSVVGKSMSIGTILCAGLT